MLYFHNLAVYALILLNLFMLGTSRLNALIRAVGLQSLLICAAIVFSAEHLIWREWLLLLGTLMIKAGLLPMLMRRALAHAHIRRDVEPLIGYATSLFIGLILLGAVTIAAHHLPALPNSLPAAISAAMFTVGIGLLLLVSRTKAITQTIGYLAMENGVYLFGFAVGIETPLILEGGVLLDVLVGIFVMGIMILQINREFDHIDTRNLHSLRG